MINESCTQFGWKGWFLSMLLLLVFVASPVWAGERYALLIGINRYQAGGTPNLHDLPGAENDLGLLQAVLQSRLNIKPDHIQILRDAEATHQNIERALQTLAQRVQPGDFVYIHYSGHGSFIPDETGHKREGAYQTWVGYGSRSPDASGLDRFDILDEELNQWLKPLDERAGELVYVADSCYSATNTRGEALATRAAPPDPQHNHPRIGQLKTPYRFQHATLVYAARDDETAQEFMGDDQKRYGLFTWHWTRSLQNAKPGETWEQVFTRAALGVRGSHSGSQHPQLEGPDARRAILGGQVSAQPAVMVREAGSEISLNAGRFSGVTVGSRYRAQHGEPPAELEVIQVSATQSQARLLRGSVQPGDFLIETEHAYATGPLKLFLLTSPTPAASPLGEQVREALVHLGGYEVVTDQRHADLVVALLRPRIHAGQPVFATSAKGESTLPEESDDAAPEVWVLTPAEHLLDEAFRIPLADTSAGLQVLRGNLTKYRQIRALRELAQAGREESPVEIQLVSYSRCSSCSEPNCRQIDDKDPACYRVPEILPLSALSDPQRGWWIGDVISFELHNRGRKAQYVYLWDVAPSGEIWVLFPRKGEIVDTARLKPDKRLRIDYPELNALMTLDVLGIEGVLALSTDEAIDPSLLEQDGYASSLVGRGASRGESLNPLEQLLLSRLEGTRGPTRLSQNWNSQWLEFQVQAARP